MRLPKNILNQLVNCTKEVSFSIGPKIKEHYLIELEDLLNEESFNASPYAFGGVFRGAVKFLTG